MAVIEGDVAIVVPNRKTSYFRYLNKKSRSEDRGTIAERATIAGSKVLKSARRGRVGAEHQREAVDAVAQPGRLRPVVEHVTEMAAAAAAMNFGSYHAQGAVFGLADGVFKRLIKARPAGAALEFRLRGKQRQIAAGTGEDAFAVLLEQRARPRALGAFLAQDFILLRGELGAPFRVGFLDLELFFRCGQCSLATQPAQRRKAKQTGGRSEQN